MAKKTTKPTKRKPTGRQKSTKSKATSTKSNEGVKGKIIQDTIPAIIGGDHDTFVTLKKKSAMLEALTVSLGIVAPAARAVGIARQTHYVWMKSDAGYKDEVDNITELCFDFVESKLLENIKGGNVIAQIFYAKTKMKNRGYIERTEIEHIEQATFVVKNEAAAATKAMEVIHNKTKKAG